MELSALSGYARVLIRPLSRRSGQRGLAAIKVNKHGCAPEGVKGAIGKPFGRLRRGETPASGKAPLCLEDMQSSRAHLARQYAASWIKQLGGAPAGAQSYWQGRFAACTFVDFSFGMVARETVGALPQTPQGAPPLDPARGRRKGTKSPLDPFWLPGLGALPYFFFSFAFFS